MFVGYVFMIICYCVLLSNCHQIIKTVCEGSTCYYLHDADYFLLSWYQSLEACNNDGLVLAKIESSQTQTVIERLVQDLPHTTWIQMWTGGRRPTDDKWRYMNGTEFNNKFTASHNEASYCLYVKLCKDLAPEYHDDNCDETSSQSQLLCQYDQSKTDSCSSSDFHVGDKCYRKTKYNGQEPNKIDWYNGETYCSQSDIQGDIAYSYLDDDTLINNIINLVDDSKVCVQLWLGVRKRIWFWMTDFNINGDTLPINYFNWDYYSYIETIHSDCLFIDRNKGNRWLTASCIEPILRYYICMKSQQTTITSNPNTTTTTTTTTITTSTTAALTTISMFTNDIYTGPVSKTTQTTKIDTTINDSNCKYALNTVNMILIIITVISMTGVVFMAVYCIHLRRKVQSPTSEANRNNSRKNDVTTSI